MRTPIPTWTFALVVVRRFDDEFLVVHERKHGQQWYLPAGRVEPGEDLAEAAVRETLEETGVRVELTGILRIEHTPRPSGDARMRVIFTARPIGDDTPNFEPNEHALEARWVTLPELDLLPLRGDEVRDIFEYVARSSNGPFPMSLLTHEGASWTPREVV